MEPEILLGVASVIVLPVSATIYRFVQKVNRHEALLPEMKDGIDRVESKVDLLTEVLLTRSLGERTRKG